MRNDGNDITRDDGRTLELVSTGWEACPHFTAAAAASPVCVDCGWLVTEHDTAA
jgi:hypothetical protein